MSDSDSGNEGAAPQERVKLESDSDAEDEASEPVVTPRAGKSKDKRPTRNEANKLRKKEMQKFHEEREAELRERVFGDKSKLLHNLQVTAECSVRKKQKKVAKESRPAWRDSDDEGYENNGSDELTNKGAYRRQLENRFKRILGTPSWAQVDRQPDDGDSDDEILRTVGHLSKSKSAQLPKGQLEFKRLKDLNRDSYEEGPLVTSIEFHPTSTACVVAGTRGIATVFAVDGKQNSKLHSLQLSNFPIRCMRLTRDGNEAIFGGSHNYFYTYDLLAGKTQRVFLPKVVTKVREFELSPCGRFIAVIGRFGEVHLLDAATKELICTLKQEHLVVSVAFSRDSKRLFTHSVDSEVVVYDIGEERQLHRFVDDGCINGSGVTVSADQQLIAAASLQGVVNVYNYAEALTQRTPRPVKTLFNLTTPITALRFNHSTEMLAFASKEVPDAMKIAHFPSGTVFQNFPGNLSNLGKPNVVRFSPQSGFMAVAGHNEKVFLYRLKHYNNY